MQSPIHEAHVLDSHQLPTVMVPTSVAVVSPSAAVSVRSLSVYWSQKWSGSRRKAGRENKPIWSNRAWHRSNSSLSFSVMCIKLPSHKNAGFKQEQKKDRSWVSSAEPLGGRPVAHSLREPQELCQPSWLIWFHVSGKPNCHSFPRF